MSELTPAERKALKARAHALDPVVLIGDKGLTEQVLAEIDRALDAHELIKISAKGLERDGRDAALTEICARAGAQAVQHIGKVLVIYRKKPEEPTPETRPKAKRKRKPNRDSRPIRSAPRKSRSASRRRGSEP